MSRKNRGFQCKEAILKALQEGYRSIITEKFNGNPLEALKNFDSIAEESLREILLSHYSEEKSRHQAWKNCKGILYEYAVFICLKEIIERDEKLNSKIGIIRGNEALLLKEYREQIVIKNWQDILLPLYLVKQV